MMMACTMMAAWIYGICMQTISQQRNRGRLHRMKVAICDDEECFLEDTHRLLDKWGHENNIPMNVAEFSNGDDLIRAQQEQSMDLIILDVIMLF